MKHILHDFYRAHRGVVIRYAVVIAICILAFFLTGIYTKENTVVAGIIVSVFLGGVMAWLLLDVFAAGRRDFAVRLERLPESDREKIIGGYDGALRLGQRRFYGEDYLLFYSYRRIRLLRYDEIRSAEPKRSRSEIIFLTLCDGKTTLMPIEPNENSAIILAALREKNPQIKIYLDGKPVSDTDRTSCGKDGTDQ